MPKTTELLTHPIPEPTLRRLPRYHHFLMREENSGKKVISCSDIARALNLDPTQIRKDLAVTGIVGKPKVGYEVPALIQALEKVLGWNNVTHAVLVGAGSLGTAILGYQQFNKYGLNIVAIFDSDANKVGQVVHGREILPVGWLPGMARQMRILTGIITVPAEAAQSVADLMVAGGIRAIWNFAPRALTVSADTIVQYEDMFSGLAVLTTRLRASLLSFSE
ncbi:MAG: redox-sensing transcriptional repressor Rex [Candidatus Omnitrophica bacterium]|nr:redox-sensing transcriptional repressor Rex [bacterium]MBK7495846.1 redox-sensing transcriptional repressor Rex [Candidatus Omnitrophota bacterium]MCE7909017.1 redox-sensing transcriptional repressor Rex [Candidatus Omnitrophica bacterium COP1]MCC6732247.1 redox-sensing transcriptional repressor Rex [Candidatus Omnitrophota bacterium]MCK6497344.1 redox-sensing transcriptional repressor Rex [bacterium]